jgi:hypothetical protein
MIDMTHKTAAFPLLAVLLFLSLVIPSHIIGIDKFATIDEPWWVISGSNYYYALTHGDYAGTVYDYHPAVTTTWVVTAGMLSYFPEYRGFGQGYFDVRKNHFDNFLLEHGKLTRDLLRNSRLVQSALIIGFALLGFFLLQKLTGRPVALLAIVLAVDAPYFLGHSRLLNHEGMLAIFTLTSLLGMAVYLRERKLLYLIISAASFGLAQLTKSSSIVVLGVIGLMLLTGLFDKENGKPFGARLLDSAKALGVWLASAALIYVILWPGMWVAPGKMLYAVYGNAFSYAFQGARLELTQSLEPARFQLNLEANGVLSYLQRWLLHSTPITWLGDMLAIYILASRSVKPATRQLVGFLVLTAFLFMVMFGIALGRDSSHYILTSFLILDVIAGLSLATGLILFSERWSILKRPGIQAAVLGGLIFFQIGSTLPFYPYYYTYENPILAETQGGTPSAYGEGLELAAAYLAQKPDASATRVLSYAGLGPFSYFYPGQTEVLKKIYLINRSEVPSIIQGMQWADYLVVYSAAQDYLPESASFLTALESVPPEKEFTIRGLRYVRIYRIADIPDSVYQEMSK